MKRSLPAIVFAFATFLAGPALAADSKPIKVLIVTGDAVKAHDWKKTTAFLKDLLTKAGMQVDVTETASTDVTPDNLAKYDVFLLNYKDTKEGKPESRWSDENKKAFADAVSAGKGLVVYHHASASFTSGSPIDKEFESVIAGGWRKQGNHGKRHVFSVTMRKPDHPITKGMPIEFKHANDELYQNSLVPEGSEIVATAYSDKSIDKKNTGKDEPVVWVTPHGKGRVCENVLGHDVDAMQSLGFQTLMIRCVEWAARGDVHYPVPAKLQKGKADK
jgi:type 1 glutamine amidotransferase